MYLLAHELRRDRKEFVEIYKVLGIGKKSNFLNYNFLIVKAAPNIKPGVNARTVENKVSSLLPLLFGSSET